VVLPICLHTNLSLADRERTLQVVIVIVIIALGILCYGAKPGLARLFMFIITVAVVPLGILVLYLVLSYDEGSTLSGQEGECAHGAVIVVRI
jgi:amino acid permease